MMVSVTELRAHLKEYLDQLEKGEEISIIRNSIEIARLVPSDQIKAVTQAKRSRVKHTMRLNDDRQVQFRQYEPHENPEPIQQLHRVALQEAGAYADNPALDSDLWAPASYYGSLGGEFWVGELDGKVVAMGAFRLYLPETDDQLRQPHQLHQSNQPGLKESTRQAELKRMRIQPDLQGQGIGLALLKLLETRAKQRDYTALVLDTVAGTPAQQFYEQHGYQETGRHQTEKFELIYYRKEL